MSTVGKIPSLNGIRALSVLVVVISHCGFGDIVPGGFGVTVFFLLSGYLITTLFIDEYHTTNKVKIPQFYARRAIRLYPAMIITIAAAYTLTYLGYIGGNATIIGALAQLFYFANYFNIFFDGYNRIPAGTSILWSLSVEEHFYFIYPLLFSAFVFSIGKMRLTYFLVFLMIVILAWRFYLVDVHNVFEARILFASDTRIDSIIVGCILALCKNPAREIDKRNLLKSDLMLIVLAILCLGFTFLYRDDSFRSIFRFTLQGIALCVLFYYSIAFAKHPIFSVLNTRIMDRIGVYSYTIYLVHFIVIELVLTNIPQIKNNFLLATIVLGISILIGFLMYNYCIK